MKELPTKYNPVEFAIASALLPFLIILLPLGTPRRLVSHSLGVRANYCNRNELAAGSSLDINCGTGFYIIINHSASTAGIYLVCGTSATITVSESQNPQFTFTSSGWKKMINNTGSATQTFTWHAITQI